jgi:hypothetical protein
VLHPATVENRYGLTSSHWVENKPKQINMMREIARLMPIEDRLGGPNHYNRETISAAERLMR